MTVTPPADTRILTNQLQVLQAAETWCARLLGGWLPGVADWEAKHQMGLFLWQDMQTARDLRTRLWELRVAKPDRFPASERVQALVLRVASAQQDSDFIAGLFLGLKRAMRNCYTGYLLTAHPTWDAPTLPLLDAAMAKLDRQLAWAEGFLPGGTESRWVCYIEEVIAAAGVFAEPAGDMPGCPPASACLLPFPEAKRDARFTVQLQGFPRPDPQDHAAHGVWQFLNYAMEMQAAETLGSVLWEAEGLPWDFYFDVSRHCYDECRHCRMGEERLVELGHELSEFPQFTGNYAWRQLYDPLRRYGMLTYVIEQDSFALKHATYKTYNQQGDQRSAEAILYDIIDETMHVRWGVKWLPELIAARGETASVEEIVAECRRAVAENSLSPAQREYGKEKAAD